MALPIFNFSDKLLQQLQTQWSSILNPVVDLFNSLKSSPPELNVYTTIGSNLYKTPDNVFYIAGLIIGGGGGGGGSGTAPAGSPGQAGGNTIFGTNLAIAYGGLPGTLNIDGQVGGSFLAKSTPGFTGFGVQGGSSQGSAGQGTNPLTEIPGGMGGGSIFGGAGAGGGRGNSNGGNGIPNTGGGGGGGWANKITSVLSGAGGSGGGAYFFLITSNFEPSYPIVIGKGGLGGTGGASGAAGGDAGSGFAVIFTSLR